MEIEDIFLFPSSHTQVTIQGTIRYMLHLEKAIIRPIKRTLKRKTFKTASTREILHLLAALIF